MSVNKLRGEASVKIGDVEIVLVATMEGLARLSSTIEAQTLGDLYKRLVMGELSTALAGIRAFTVRGTSADGKSLSATEAVNAAMESFALDDSGALAEAFAKLMTALFRKKPGGAEESSEGKPDAPTP